jgi:hypothetical protein
VLRNSLINEIRGIIKEILNLSTNLALIYKRLKSKDRFVNGAAIQGLKYNFAQGHD